MSNVFNTFLQQVGSFNETFNQQISNLRQNVNTQNLIVNTNSQFFGNTTFNDTAVSGVFIATGDITSLSNLSATPSNAAVVFNQSLNVDNDLIVDGLVSFNNVTSSGSITGTNINISGLATNTIAIAGDGLNNAINIKSGIATLNKLGVVNTTGTITFNGNSNITGNVSTNNLSINSLTGNTQINGSLTTNNTFNTNILNLTGNITSTTNNININNTTGAITSNGSITTNHINVLNDLFINTNKLSINSINGDLTINANLTNTNNTFINGTLNLSDNINTPSNSIIINHNTGNIIANTINTNNITNSIGNLTFNASNILYSNKNLINTKLNDTTNTIYANKLNNSSSWNIATSGTSPINGQILYYNGSNIIWFTPTAGNLLGPVSSTNNGIAVFQNTVGNPIVNTNVTIDNSNNLTLPAQLNVNNISISTLVNPLSISSNGQINFNSDNIINANINDASSDISANRLRINATDSILLGTTTPTTNSVLIATSATSAEWGFNRLVSVYEDYNTSNTVNLNSSTVVPNSATLALLYLCGGGGSGNLTQGGGAGGSIFGYPIVVSSGLTINYSLGFGGQNNNDGGNSSITINNYIFTCNGGLSGLNGGNGGNVNIGFISVNGAAVPSGNANYNYHIVGGANGGQASPLIGTGNGGNTYLFTGGIRNGTRAGGGSSAFSNGGDPTSGPINGFRGSGGGSPVSLPESLGGGGYVKIVFLTN